jgi:hypothetical protein
MRPNRKKGTLSVVIEGLISRITMTSSGFLGTSLSDMMGNFRVILFSGSCASLRDTEALSVSYN